MAKKKVSPKGAKTLRSTKSAAKQQPAAAKRPAVANVPTEFDACASEEGQLFPIVALGASAGGLEAFTSFLKALPADTGMGFILIQHMDPTHESFLVDLLQRSTRMPIDEVSDQTVVEPNHVYILPPNALMTIANGVLSLTRRGTRSFKDYPIDRFFVSLAEDRKNRAIGVVLSGTASDGTRGLLAIKAEGGITFAQDSESAQFASMPDSAVASGCVDFTLPPEKIAQELSRINGHPYIRRTAPAEPSAPISASDGVRRILKQLRLATGVNFELYKPAMIGRRIARRMALQKTDTHEQYLNLIRKDRPELMALYEDIFIHVTGFFRDPESLEAVQRQVFLNLISGDKGSRTIRIWVPGCSSGEEVYSLGMLLFEQLGERRTEVTVQIFGTDISERSVQRARAGIYPPSCLVDVSPERQRRFFSRQDGNFQITKAIRDVCVFAKHDLAKDPPFSRMDLISCRNVLIYMGPALQKKVIEAFHYALKLGGHLLLGKSESLSAYSSLFTAEDSKHKILTRRSLESPLQVHAGLVERSSVERPPGPVRGAPPVPDIRREAERLLLDKYAPAAVVVDSNLQIIHFQGNTGPFLAPASGEPSFHLLRIVRPELLVDMRTAIYNAKKLGSPVQKQGIRFKHNGDSSVVDIHVSPIKPRHNAEPDYLVVFRKLSDPQAGHARPSKDSPGVAVRDRAKAELAAKEREIASLREQLQDLVQDHEAADEEVRSMNEEILSSNEELQSSNEELETAKEELESTNEELTTLNDELQKRNSDLSQMTDDLSNVLVAMDMPIVLLDSQLRIRRFTPAAARVLNLINTDIGRPLSDMASTLPLVNWKELTTGVMQASQARELEVQDREGRYYALRIRPYRSGTDRVEGILIAMVDVSSLKRSIGETAQARGHAKDLQARLTLAGEGLRIGIWEYDIAADEFRGTDQWNALYGIASNKPWRRGEWLARVHRDDRQAVSDDIDRIIKSAKVSDLEYRVVWPDGTTHWLNRRAELVQDAHKKPVRILGVSIDITGQKSIEQERLAFSSRIASAQEAERRRIVRELHDGVIQDLAGMAIDLSGRAAKPPSPAELKADYKSFQDRAVKAAEAARQVAYELHPTEVDDLGLENALRAYCQELSETNDVAIEFQSRKIPKLLKREIASCLYKVAQEGLRNVLKHSHAKRAKVILDGSDKQIRLRLEDEGRGFALPTLQNSAGLGIASMRERVELVNGKFRIRSEPGKGTQILAETPLTEEEEL